MEMSENEASLVEEGAGRVDAAGETPIPTGTLSIQPADDTPDPTQNEISRQLQQAIVVKFLVDHLFAGILLLLLIAALDYNKQKIKMQLALKTHLNKMALWALLLFVSASISLCYLIYPYMGYTENIIQRLLIIYAVNSSETQSIWAVLWNCCLTDIVAQMLVVLCKTLICLVTAHNNMAALRTLGSSIRRYVAKCGRNVYRILWSPATHSPQPSQECQDDIEAQGSAHSSNRHTARSPSHTALTYTHTPTHTHQLTRRGGSMDLPSTPDDDTSETSDQLTQDVYVTRQLCNLFDIWFFVYRGLLPIPLWVENLSTASVLGRSLFPILYLTLKISDMSWKIKGAIEAGEYFLGQKLEYGRYARTSEYDPLTSTYDCPICFDSPKKAVVLNCSHIFCEQCVYEWLEKEKTCPVCRQEVQSAAQALERIKKEALGGSSYSLM